MAQSETAVIAELTSHGAYVMPAMKDVLDGIRKTETIIQRSMLQVTEQRRGGRKERGKEREDKKASIRGEEKPVKQTDHAADAMRYYINSLPDWRFE